MTTTAAPDSQIPHAELTPELRLSYYKKASELVAAVQPGMNSLPLKPLKEYMQLSSGVTFGDKMFRALRDTVKNLKHCCRSPRTRLLYEFIWRDGWDLPRVPPDQLDGQLEMAVSSLAANINKIPGLFVKLVPITSDLQASLESEGESPEYPACDTVIFNGIFIYADALVLAATLWSHRPDEASSSSLEDCGVEARWLWTSILVWIARANLFGLTAAIYVNSEKNIIGTLPLQATIDNPQIFRDPTKREMRALEDALTATNLNKEERGRKNKPAKEVVESTEEDVMETDEEDDETDEELNTDGF
ncbi:hypothetical protein HDU93_006084 [Gonapodya sp. JEL0774]|nr:hypothetical protein HDU93_006084 [Gonapodya sp. JEL0774]